MPTEVGKQGLLSALPFEVPTRKLEINCLPRLAKCQLRDPGLECISVVTPQDKAFHLIAYAGLPEKKERQAIL